MAQGAAGSGRGRAARWAVLLAAAWLGGLACRNAPAPVAAPPALRVAIMAPAAAEMVAALGATAAVVAVGDFVDFPPELTARPRIGAYDAPSLERLLTERVTLYVTSRSEAGGPARDRLRALGIEVLELDTETVTGTLAGFERLGARLGHGELAGRKVAEIRARLAAVAGRAAEAPRRRVLCLVGREPLYAAGPGSYLDELITVAGGVNVLADARSPFALVSLEAVLARAPEVIVETSDNRPGALRGQQPGPWAAWPFLPAVRDGRVFFVDPSRFSVPGPRLAELGEGLARMIHPELFGAPQGGEFTPLGGGS